MEPFWLFRDEELNILSRSIFFWLISRPLLTLFCIRDSSGFSCWDMIWQLLWCSYAKSPLFLEKFVKNSQIFLQIDQFRSKMTNFSSSKLINSVFFGQHCVFGLNFDSFLNFTSFSRPKHGHRGPLVLLVHFWHERKKICFDRNNQIN